VDNLWIKSSLCVKNRAYEVMSVKTNKVIHRSNNYPQTFTQAK